MTIAVATHTYPSLLPATTRIRCLVTPRLAIIALEATTTLNLQRVLCFLAQHQMQREAGTPCNAARKAPSDPDERPRSSESSLHQILQLRQRAMRQGLIGRTRRRHRVLLRHGSDKEDYLSAHCANLAPSATDPSSNAGEGPPSHLFATRLANATTRPTSSKSRNCHSSCNASCDRQASKCGASRSEYCRQLSHSSNAQRTMSKEAMSKCMFQGARGKAASTQFVVLQQGCGRRGACARAILRVELRAALRVRARVVVRLAQLDAVVIERLQLRRHGGLREFGLGTAPRRRFEERPALVLGQGSEIGVLDLACIDVAGRRDVPREQAGGVQVLRVGRRLLAPLWIHAAAQLVVLELVVKDAVHVVELARLGTLGGREDHLAAAVVVLAEHLHGHAEAVDLDHAVRIALLLGMAQRSTGARCTSTCGSACALFALIGIESGASGGDATSVPAQPPESDAEEHGNDDDGADTANDDLDAFGEALGVARAGARVSSVETGLAEALLFDAHGGELLGGGGHVDERSEADGGLARASDGHVGRLSLRGIEAVIARKDGVGAAHKGGRENKVGGEEARVEVGAVGGAGERAKRLEGAEAGGAVIGRAVARTGLEAGVERVDGYADAAEGEGDVHLEVAGDVVAAVGGRADAPGAVEGVESAFGPEVDAGGRVKDGDGVGAGDDAGGADGDGFYDAVLELDADFGRVVVADGEEAVALAAVFFETLEADAHESATGTGVCPEACEDGAGLGWADADVEECGVAGGVEVGLDETVGGRAYADDAGKVARVHVLVGDVVAGAKGLGVDDEARCVGVAKEHGGGLYLARGGTEEVADVEGGVLVYDRVCAVVEFEDAEALVTFARVGSAVLVCEPEVAAASVELSVDLLICNGDGNGVGELTVCKAAAEDDASAVESAGSWGAHASICDSARGGARG
ncbi:hypothetical protein L1887_51843 [Cichorium endivia]|nr:hypothetical protein L1887_51843 [Cichorium endivia]